MKTALVALSALHVMAEMLSFGHLKTLGNSGHMALKLAPELPWVQNCLEVRCWQWLDVCCNSLLLFFSVELQPPVRNFIFGWSHSSHFVPSWSTHAFQMHWRGVEHRLHFKAGGVTAAGKQQQ